MALVSYCRKIGSNCEKSQDKRNFRGLSLGSWTISYVLSPVIEIHWNSTPRES